jgi:hypothetical protein
VSPEDRGLFCCRVGRRPFQPWCPCPLVSGLSGILPALAQTPQQPADRNLSTQILTIQVQASTPKGLKLRRRTTERAPQSQAPNTSPSQPQPAQGGASVGMSNLSTVPPQQLRSPPAAPRSTRERSRRHQSHATAIFFVRCAYYIDGVPVHDISSIHTPTTRI